MNRVFATNVVRTDTTFSYNEQVKNEAGFEINNTNVSFNLVDEFNDYSKLSDEQVLISRCQSEDEVYLNDVLLGNGDNGESSRIFTPIEEAEIAKEDAEVAAPVVETPVQAD